MRCQLPTWEEVYELARRLAFRIVGEGWDPDLLVAIGRGGYTPGRLLADFLHEKALTAFRIEHYTAGAEKQETARVVGSLDDDLSGLRVLIVDDVNDSGQTLEAAVGFVRERGAAEVRTAVLQEKSTTGFAADHAAERVEEWRWIVYPWAVIEDLTGFLRKMDPRPATVDDAARRLDEAYGVRVPDRTLEDVFRLWPDQDRERSR